ncbi:acetyl-CoA synthetase-like protein [Aspergillus candidus]|uniref:Acetyl-CoA synthetase-like protein n=1 Tax=Aspergillus candidus TaxID=41067 RepID=A0A2I2FE55_ASPCN|nr:acetyl-CoA synthetase-like protein [Aspergillus candidus]PLB38912.1 acetyl-CoA synthetase-like protein [Aspergillus candidus]
MIDYPNHNDEPRQQTDAHELPATGRITSFADRLDLPSDTVFHLAWGTALGVYQNIDVVTLACYTNETGRRCQVARPSDKTLTAALCEVAATAEPIDEISLCQAAVRVSSHLEEDAAVPHPMLELVVQSRTDPMTAQLHFSEGAVTPLQAEGMLRVFCRVVDDIVSQPEATMGDLQLWGPWDLTQLRHWSPPAPPRVEACVHRLILNQAAVHPERSAVVAWDGTWSYAELEHLSARLAAHLGARGVTRCSLVPICQSNSRWVVVARLAVMRVGAAYLHLDPTHPLDRLQAIGRLTRATIMLTDEAHADLARQLDLEGVLLGPGHLPPQTDEFVDAAVTPEDPLYVVCTSGSTGIPKAVLVEHGAFCTAARTLGPALGLTATSRVLHLASLAVDISNRDVFMTLIHGGCVCMPRDGEAWDDVAAVFARYEVNWVSMTPSVAHMVEPGRLPQLQALVLAGERPTASVVSKWAPYTNLINGYGCSECAAVSAFEPHLRPSTDPQSVRSHRGHATLWIVDPDDPQRLQPVGAVGEIVIEAASVARGYLGLSDQALDVFVDGTTLPWRSSFPDHAPGVRFYRTGDLGQHTGAGTLRVLGRKDHQVKIRGFRVELEEIERATQPLLPQLHGGVDDVVVDLVRLPGGAESTLVAFLTHRAGSVSLNGNDLQEGLDIAYERLDYAIANLTLIENSLRSRLPSYMKPALVIPLGHPPRTRSGKLDRRRLCQLAADIPPAVLTRCRGSSISSPASPLADSERLLLRLWMEVLPEAPGGFSGAAHFFHCGGHSIAAMSLVAHARECGLSLTVADVFAHPVLADLARVMRPERAESPPIVPFQLLTSTAWSLQHLAAECGVTPAEVEDAYPATAVQEGLLVRTAQRPHDYVDQRAFALPADIDLSRLVDTWRAVSSANPILRTRLAQLGPDDMVQVVLHAPVACPVVEGPLDDYLDRDWGTSFGPGTALVRLAVVQEEGRAFCVLTMHHAVYDHWTLPLLRQQLEAAYAGRPLESRPFNHFIRHVVDSQSKAESYWREALAESEAVPFPPRPSGPWTPMAQSSAQQSVPLSPHNGPRDFTISTWIQLAWALTAAQYTGASEVVFGVMVSGRDAPVPGIDRTTGPTIATAPLAVCLARGDTVRQALESMQRQIQTISDFAQLGLVRIARLGAAAAQACHFETLVSVQVADHTAKPAQQEILGQTHHHRRALPREYALALECTIHDGHVAVRAEFDDRVLPHCQMDRVLGLFGHFLQIINRQHDLSLADLPVLPSSDMAELLRWNGTLPESARTSIPETIQQHIRTSPERRAVYAWDGSFNYRELHFQAMRLARRLAAAGMGPGCIIPICMEKSRWTPAAMLAVLLTGAAFVTLEPSQPVAYRQTSAPLAAALDLPAVVLVDHDDAAGTAADWVDASTADATAYFVFTSGSTGMPKGILVSHAAFCSGVREMGRTGILSADTRILQLASYAFDISVIEQLATLIFGGCLVIPSVSQCQDDLAGALRHFQADTLLTTPTTARLLHHQATGLLRHLMLGGEPLSLADRDYWVPRLNLCHGYGPAECAGIPVTQLSLDSHADPRRIGRSTTAGCWIVDPESPDRLLPIGAIGELLLEGPSLARGYLDDPLRTAASFLDAPAWLRCLRPSARLYRTGDLVQYAPDGSLLFVARKDNQVKLRGQRVELGHVETHTMAAFPGSPRAVAEIVEPAATPGRPVLAVFVQRAAGPSASLGPATLETPSGEFHAAATTAYTALAAQLPRYMVPGVFLPITSIPCGATGKVDRRTLRELGARLSRADWEAYQSQSSKKEAPSTPTEQHLQECVSQLLDLPPDTVGMNDHFFRLGGDSLHAMRMVGLLRERHLDIHVADIFANPILEDLARLTTALLPNADVDTGPFALVDSPDLWPLRQSAAVQCQVSCDAVEDVYPCTPMQKGLFALSLKYPGAFWACADYEVPDELDFVRLQAAWAAVVQAHPILRTRIIRLETDGDLMQAVLREDVLWSGPVQDTSLVEGGPLACARWMPESRQFHLSLHHALYDGFSMRLLHAALQDAYHAATAPPTVCSFRPFVEYVQRIPPAEVEASWRAQFKGFTGAPFPALPTPQYIPEPRSSQSHTTALSLNHALGATMSTVLRLAWALTTAQYTGSTDLVFGVVTSGRGAPVTGIDAVIGPTLATVPLRVQWQTSDRLRPLLRRVQEQMTAIMPVEQVGISRIAGVSDEARQACQFQTLLVVQPSGDWSSGFLERIKSPSDGTPAEDAQVDTYGLTLVCEPDADSVTIRAIFDASMITPLQMSRMLHQFTTMIHAINDERLSVAQCPLSADDKRDLIQWNALPDRPRRTMIDLLTPRAAQQPSSLAVHAWDGDWTYDELWTQASGLASHLAAQIPVHENFMVPILLEKSRWVPVAVLAVIRAGGAFVLLDASQPRRRLEEICQEIDAAFIISSAVCANIATTLAPKVVSVPLDGALPWTNTNPDVPLPAAAAQDALYVVYTSGSTGRPKGIVIEHGAFAASLQAYLETVSMNPEVRGFQFASYAFDVSVTDLLAPLVAGGCVCIPSDDDCQNRLAHAATALRANWADFTPSLLRNLDPEDVPTVTTIVVGGESLARSDISKWSPHKRLMNIYGPAECCVLATVQPNVTTASDPANIGWPTGGACWIVDPADPDHLLPVGAVGELLIEGPILGRGYLGQPARTAQSFVACPSWIKEFRPAPPSRLYRTGDLVRYGLDGSLHFVGRADTQVKLRGQRIELAAVEYQVEILLPMARQVITEVVRRADTDILMAFLLLPGGEAEHKLTVGRFLIPTPDHLSRIDQARDELRARLPRYMVPLRFLCIRALPLTRTGKTDRRRLREEASQLSAEDLARVSAGSQSHRRAPASADEETIQRLCARVLNRSADAIALDDSFFDNGGDSITAMKLASIAQRQDIPLTVASILGSRRISSLITTRGEPRPANHTPSAPFALLPKSSQEDIIRAAARQCAVPETQVEDVYPCTPMQEGLIAGTSRDPAAYIGQIDLPLRADVDRERLHKAWNCTAIAHPILRTRFVHIERAMWQVVVTDPGAWDQSPDEGSVKSMFGRRLVSLNLLTGGSPVVLRLTIHHGLYDGMSLPQLLRQVDIAYKGLPLTPSPFNRFVAYLQETTNHSTMAAYWREQFRDVQAAIFPAPPTARYTPQATSRLDHKAALPVMRYRNCSLATLVRAAWAVIAAHYTDVTDVVMGVTLAGRSAPVPGIEALTGPTFATVPVRIQLDPSQSLDAWLQQVQDQSTSMIPFEHTGLHHIRQLGPDAARACRFQTHLGVQFPDDDNGEEDNTTGNSSVFVQAPAGRAPPGVFASYALVLICTPSADGRSIHFAAHYDPHVLAADETRRLVVQCAGVLHQLVDRTVPRVQDLQILTPEEISQLSRWNAEVPEVERRTLVDLIVAHADLHPTAPALVFEETETSYAEMCTTAWRFAAYLRTRGVRTETIVPLCFPKGPWTVISLLAVLMAGGCCLLLDAGHPRARLASLVRQAGSHLVLAHPTTAGHVVDEEGVEVVVVSPDFLAALPPLDDVMRSDSSSDGAAFLIFTSGSTGQPKGIILEHAQLSTSIRYHRDGMRMSRASRSLHFASYAFDASIYEICSTLVAGGCVCIVSDQDRLNDLAGAMCRHSINWATLTNTTARLLHPAQVPDLQTLVLGGEAVTQDVVDRWAAHVTLVNGYGPAEATICALGDMPPEGWRPGTIGTTVGAVSWITTPSNPEQLAAIGAVGELLLEGPVLARGYLRDPEKTAAAFLQGLPWLTRFRHGRRDIRVYRTGDLVQYTPQGELRYVGRKDTQVKLRGQRIELGDIECRLSRCMPHARDLAVEAITPVDGAPMLMAFAYCPGEVTDDDLLPPSLFAAQSESFRRTANTALEDLKQTVPGYMVPSVVVPLRRLPLTPTGKTNRRQLREEAAALSRDDIAGYIAAVQPMRMPTTPTERLLQGILSNVFDRPAQEISMDADFVQLGGDSVTAMKTAAQAGHQGLPLTVVDLLQTHKLSELAARLAQCKPPGLLSAPERPVPGSYFGFHTQQQFVQSVHQELPRAFTSTNEIEEILPATQGQVERLNRPVFYLILQTAGRVAPERLVAASTALIQRHSILRTVFFPYRGHVVQVVLHRLNSPVESVTLQDMSPSAVDQHCAADSPPTPVFAQPATKFIVANSGQSTSALILRLSHAQFDGLSTGILWEDLVALYHGQCLPDPVPYTTHLYRWLAASTPAALDYWRSLLAGSQLTTISRETLAEDSEKQFLLAHRIVHVPELPAGITSATMAKAAWAVTLAQHTGERDVVFAQTAHGRHAATAHAVGLCINQLAVRVSLADLATGQEVLDRVHQQHIQSLPFDGLEYADVVRECTPWPDHEPGASVVTHQNFSLEKPLELDGVQCPLRNWTVDPPRPGIAIESTPGPAGQWHLRLSTSTGTLDQSEADSLLRQYEHVLVQLASAPTTSLSHFFPPS